MSASEVEAKPHTPVEDALALFTGTLVVAVGLTLFRRVGVGTGGAPGLALLVTYLSNVDLPRALVLVNLPFYAFSLWRMGWRFTLRTIVAISLLSAESWALPRLVEISQIDPVFGSGFGGLLVGVGLLILIRHKASLGGVGIVAFWLQERHGLSAGKVQMGFDALILAGTIPVLDPHHVLLSFFGALALNMVIATNHRRGRYIGY